MEKRMNKIEQRQNDHSNVSLIMASFSSKDGGCIYIEKQSKFFFGEFDFFVLSSAYALLGLTTRLYLGRIPTKLKRFGLFSFLDKLVMNFLAYCHAKNFLEDYRYRDTKKIICVSEDIISLAVATRIKKARPNVLIHFSMLDLPWSYPARNCYKRVLRDDFIQLFIKNVASADFTTEEMASIFHDEGFVGMSLVTYSAIDVIAEGSSDSKILGSTNDVFAAESKLVYAGSLRASKEFSQFCDALKRLIASGTKDYGLDLYGPSDFVHSAVSCFGFIPPKDINDILQNYSFGLVPMSFDEEDGELIRTSFPSKTWLYLSNGIVPIVLAPASAGVSKLINDYSIGVVISDVRDISATLEGLSREEEYKRAMANYKNFQVSLSQNFKLYREELSRENNG
jgi:hypothetical protein